MATDPMPLYGRDITIKTFFSRAVWHTYVTQKEGKVHGVERPWTITYNVKGTILFN